MISRGIFIITVAICALATGCSEDVTGIEELSSETRTGVFICNEGNFTFGNASLSFYNTDSNKLVNQVFQNANGFPLGDVVQSMALKDSLGFIIINNSGKIFVINANDFSHMATISGLTSPRYIHFVNETKAYVSELYSKSMTIIDLNTFDITGHVHVGKSTEQMVQVNDFVYVTGWFRNNKVYKVNTTDDSVTDSLEVSKQPNSIQADKNNKLWVLCDGGYEGIPGGKDSAVLYRISPNPYTIEARFAFPVHELSPAELQINAGGDTLYFVNSSWSGSPDDANGGIFQMDIGQNELPSTPLIHDEDRLFYGLGIDPRNSEIYVSDAVDYQQRGWVYRYTRAGAVVDSFKTGIIPGSFAFKQ